MSPTKCRQRLQRAHSLLHAPTTFVIAKSYETGGGIWNLPGEARVETPSDMMNLRFCRNMLLDNFLEVTITNFSKLSTAAAALTLTAVMSTGAVAAHHDMTCGEYNAMSPGDQMSALSEMGRAGAREKMTGADSIEEGVGTEQADSDGTMNDDTGKEGQHDMARGDDDAYSAAVVEHCMGGDDLMLKDVRHPSEDATAE